jgi:hypothetical protein
MAKATKCRPANVQAGLYSAGAALPPTGRRSQAARPVRRRMDSEARNSSDDTALPLTAR